MFVVITGLSRYSISENVRPEDIEDISEWYVPLFRFSLIEHKSRVDYNVRHKREIEYLLDIIAKVIEILLRKMNVPYNEAEAFSMQIKERRMGELFENFKGYDVQAVRNESQL